MYRININGQLVHSFGKYLAKEVEGYRFSCHTFTNLQCRKVFYKAGYLCQYFLILQVREYILRTEKTV